MLTTTKPGSCSLSLIVQQMRELDESHCMLHCIHLLSPIVQFMGVLDEPHSMLHCFHLLSRPHSLCYTRVSFLHASWDPYTLHPECKKKRKIIEVKYFILSKFISQSLRPPLIRTNKIISARRISLINHPRKCLHRKQFSSIQAYSSFFFFSIFLNGYI